MRRNRIKIRSFVKKGGKEGEVAVWSWTGRRLFFAEYVASNVEVSIVAVIQFAF